MDKKCPDCRKTKPTKEFYSPQATYCKECARRRTQERNWRVRGIPMDHSLRRMIEEGLEGRCAICGRTMEEVRGKQVELAVDHNHVTGNVRSLLCPNCNKAIGLFDDDPERMRNAAQYIEFFLAAEEIVPAADPSDKVSSGDGNDSKGKRDKS